MVCRLPLAGSAVSAGDEPREVRHFNRGSHNRSRPSHRSEVQPFRAFRAVRSEHIESRRLVRHHNEMLWRSEHGVLTGFCEIQILLNLTFYLFRRLVEPLGYPRNQSTPPLIVGIIDID